MLGFYVRCMVRDIKLVTLTVAGYWQQCHQQTTQCQQQISMLLMMVLVCPGDRFTAREVLCTRVSILFDDMLLFALAFNAGCLSDTTSETLMSVHFFTKSTKNDYLLLRKDMLMN